MQPIQRPTRTLAEIGSAAHYLFARSYLRAAVPDISDTVFRNLLSRAVRGGSLTRICRGLYLHGADYPHGLVLFHAAARLRAGVVEEESRRSNAWLARGDVGTPFSM